MLLHCLLFLFCCRRNNGGWVESENCTGEGEMGAFEVTVVVFVVVEEGVPLVEAALVELLGKCWSVGVVGHVFCCCFGFCWCETDRFSVFDFNFVIEEKRWRKFWVPQNTDWLYSLEDNL